jgi:hypothetical protein
MEMILNLPPMSQYDAAATPMWRCFNNTASHPAFNARPSQVDLNQTNTARNKWSHQSEKFNFDKEDEVPDAEFNEVIWVAIRGEQSKCPAPKHAAFIHTQTEDAD